MAQLTDDCFATGDRLMPLDEARAVIADRVACVAETETVALVDAENRILAEQAVAAYDLPPFDNSAVDGYAVRFADLAAKGETHLPIRGRIAAGGAPLAAEPGQAVRIFTGAAMPAGCDTVFMQEDATLEGDHVRLPSGLKLGANRRLAGEDLGRGAAALSSGRRLGPAELALLAAIGRPEVRVRRKLRVAVFSTGDELALPGVPLRPGQLYDANRPMLVALLRRASCAVADLGILPDRREAVSEALRHAAGEHDLVLSSGGVSTGEEDHVKAALTESGSLTFWRLGIKPGRPVAMGVVTGTAFMGLPGNPVAAFVTFALVARPLIASLAGETYRPPLPIPVEAAFSYRKKEGRREYVRAKLVRRADGTIAATKHPREGAGVLTSLTETDGLVELPEATTRVEAGESVGFLPYSVLG